MIQSKVHELLITEKVKPKTTQFRKMSRQEAQDRIRESNRLSARRRRAREKQERLEEEELTKELETQCSNHRKACNTSFGRIPYPKMDNMIIFLNIVMGIEVVER